MAWRDWRERLRAARRRRGRAAGFFDARGADVLSTVGASFCTPDIDAVTGGGTGVFDLEVFLVRDPRNAADPNAIVVQSRDGRRLAYLDRKDAQAFAPAFEMIGADALVRATASRSNPGTAWVVTLHVDRALLDELCREAAGPAGAGGVGTGAAEGDAATECSGDDEDGGEDAGNADRRRA